MPYRKFEFIIPVFFGCLLSLIINALVIYGNIVENQGPSPETVTEERSAAMGDALFFSRLEQERPDFILSLYKDPQAQMRVFDFFANICASREIAEVILFNANQFDIPPALAVALAWEESKLDPTAVNNNRNKSTDRGLFQLNDRSFPRLEAQAFFSPETNAWYAMNHLRHCLNTGGSEVAALAMYNAGTMRVNSSGAPKSTLDYISRILESRREIETRFMEWEAWYQEQLDDGLSALADAESEHPILVPLMPLAGR